MEKIEAGNGKCIKCGSSSNIGEYHCGACNFALQRMIEDHNIRIYGKNKTK